jgi:hypothetical protein
MKLKGIRLLVLTAALMLLVGCGGETQAVPVPTPTAIKILPASTLTQMPPTPTPTLAPTPTQLPPTPTTTLAPTATPTALPTPAPSLAITTKTPSSPAPAIIGTVRFQIDTQHVATAAQLGQASIVGPSLIHLEGGRIRLYLQARANKHDKDLDGVNIISLTSTNGTQWDVDPGIRIPHGRQSDVDSEAGEPGVYLGLDDKYHMAYTGRYMGVNRRGGNQLMHRVVFAVSDDGLTWTKLNQHYADPENINDFASSADVTIVNGEHVIYYTGQRNIIRATYDGLEWARQEIAFSAGHDSTMVKLEDVYYMFLMMPKALVYARNPDTKKDLLFMSVSGDGVNWPNNYYQVIVEDVEGSELDAQDIQDPGAILLSDGSLRIFLNDFGGKSIYSIKPVEALPKP